MLEVYNVKSKSRVRWNGKSLEPVIAPLIVKPVTDLTLKNSQILAVGWKHAIRRGKDEKAHGRGPKVPNQLGLEIVVDRKTGEIVACDPERHRDYQKDPQYGIVGILVTAFNGTESVEEVRFLGEFTEEAKKVVVDTVEIRVEESANGHTGLVNGSVVAQPVFTQAKAPVDSARTPMDPAEADAIRAEINKLIGK